MVPRGRRRFALACAHAQYLLAANPDRGDNDGQPGPDRFGARRRASVDGVERDEVEACLPGLRQFGVHRIAVRGDDALVPAGDRVVDRADLSLRVPVLGTARNGQVHAVLGGLLFGVVLHGHEVGVGQRLEDDRNPDRCVARVGIPADPPVPDDPQAVSTNDPGSNSETTAIRYRGLRCPVTQRSNGRMPRPIAFPWARQCSPGESCQTMPVRLPGQPQFELPASKKLCLDASRMRARLRTVDAELQVAGIHKLRSAGGADGRLP
jgi:hypothetical protein